MKQVAAINGSPRANGVSAMFIEQIGKRLKAQVTTYQATKLLKEQGSGQGGLEQILTADCLLIAYPLYVDELPAPLIKLLTLLDEATQSGTMPLPKVYVVCNCGFYEGHQISTSLKILKNFCRRAGFKWQYAVAIGAGGLFRPGMKDLSKGITATVSKALDGLAKDMDDIKPSAKQSDKQDVYVGPRIPRFLYKAVGEISWRVAARKNGVGRRIYDRPNEDV